MHARRLTVAVLIALACSPLSARTPLPHFDNDYSHAAGLTTLGKIAPVHSQSVAAAPWGVQFNPIAPHHDIPAGKIDMKVVAPRTTILLDRTARLGVKWARVSVNWVTVEDGGKYHWAYLDGVINGLVKRKITPYVCIHGGHPKHTKGLPPRNGKGLSRWRAYVETLVGRYRDRVDHWEIWNEPNYRSFWKPAPDAKAYVEMVKFIVPVIRKLQPGAKIIGGSQARVDHPYAETCFKAGIAPFINVYSIHPYNAFPEGSVQKMAYPVLTPTFYTRSSHQLDDLKKLLTSGGKRIALWQGECGYPSAEHSHGWQGTGPWGRRIQGKWLLRRMLIDVSAGAEVSCYFALSEYKLNPNDEKTNVKGLLRYGDAEHKPAYFAYQNLCALIHGNVKPTGKANAVFTITDPGSLFGAKGPKVRQTDLTDGSNSFLAYWIPWRAQEWTVPGRASLQKRQWKSPVLVDLLNGGVYQIRKTQRGGYSVPIVDYPLVITERAAVGSLISERPKRAKQRGVEE